MRAGRWIAIAVVCLGLAAAPAMGSMNSMRQSHNHLVSHKKLKKSLHHSHHGKSKHSKHH